MVFEGGCILACIMDNSIHPVKPVKTALRRRMKGGFCDGLRFAMEIGPCLCLDLGLQTILRSFRHGGYGASRRSC
jgi:hypothetical protein